jgi:hypothetical protein
MATKKTAPKVFIIESLRFVDEKKKLHEGDVISKILMLSNIDCKYYYVRTKKEFEYVLNIFFKSQYRYLHISCHGNTNKNALILSLDEITFDELGEMLQPNFEKKRLFLSACSLVNYKLAESIIPRTKCYSLIGPANDIYFRDAVILWASFYHLIFKKEFEKMTRKEILLGLKKVSNMFSISLNYFSISKSKGFKQDEIKPSLGKNFR